MSSAQRYRYLRRVLRVLAAATLLASFLPLAATTWWVLDLFAHFRIQYLLAQSILVVCLIPLREARWVTFLLVGIVVNSLPLLPYLPMRTVPDGNDSFSVLAVNVARDSKAAAGLLEAIATERPDLVLVVELSGPWLERLPALTSAYPYAFTQPREDPFGLGVFSRTPVAAFEVVQLGPTIGVETVLTLGEEHVRFIGVHLLPPLSGAAAAGRNAQLAELARLAGETRMPLAICGDFNISPYSPHFKNFLAATGLVDARAGRWPTYTWPTFNPLLRIPIDHCLVSAGLAVVGHRRLPAFGSDHYPLLVEWARGTSR